MLTGCWMNFPIIIEPGIIEVELDRDSIFSKSRVIQGENTMKLLEVKKITTRYFDNIYNGKNSDFVIDSLMRTVYSDSVAMLIQKNKDNFIGVYLINRFYDTRFFTLEQKGNILAEITSNKLRNSYYFIKLYSKYLSQVGEYNRIGAEAVNFQLKDRNDKIVLFPEISKNKTVFVEKSGSWCGNLTYETRKLDTIYKQYKDKGFEIVTIVPELKIDRWKNWLSSEKFPWINLVELDFESNDGTVYCEQIFNNGNYLVDEAGVVIANNLTPELLKEILMKKYEPRKFADYLKEKWVLPDNIILLDKEDDINTFDELVARFSGQAIFIDCYATWCSPCIAEFKYKVELAEYLSKHNIALVYISFDDDISDSKWLDFIRKHELVGYHMRTNNEFNNSFQQATNINGQLPTYLIIDKSGNVVENNAYRPSEKEELFKQLELKLKK